MTPLQHALHEPDTKDPIGVLVVDDEFQMRKLVQLSLQRNGFQVWLAEDGLQAVDLYRKERENIEVVLLDIRMPNLDGPGTLDALRELNPDILACFMTGHSGDYDPEELRRRGAASVIYKPFQLQELTATLRLLVHTVPGK